MFSKAINFIQTLFNAEDNHQPPEVLSQTQTQNIERSLAVVDVIKTKLVGVTFKNDDGTNRQDIIQDYSAGDVLTLDFCPTEKYPYKVEVQGYGVDVLGCISKELSETLYEYLEDNCEFRVKILEVTGGDFEKSYGCNIQIDILS